MTTSRKKCVMCGAPVPPKHSAYCSRECLVRAKKARERAAYAAMRDAVASGDEEAIRAYDRSREYQRLVRRREAMKRDNTIVKKRCRRCGRVFTEYKSVRMTSTGEYDIVANSYCWNCRRTKAAAALGVNEAWLHVGGHTETEV